MEDKIYVIYKVEGKFGEVSKFNCFAVEGEDAALNYCNKVNRLIGEYKRFIELALEADEMYSDESLDVWEDRLLDLQEGIRYSYNEVELR